MNQWQESEEATFKPPEQDPNNLWENYEYVGFTRRLGAWVLDWLLFIYPLQILLLWLLGDHNLGFSEWLASIKELYFQMQNQQSATAFDSGRLLNISGTESLLVRMLPWFFFIGCWLYSSTTPGKILNSAYIVDARDGSKPSNLQFLLRCISYFVSMLPFGLGFFWIIGDPKKQGWHDKIANTIVVRKAPEKAPVHFDNRRQ